MYDPVANESFRYDHVFMKRQDSPFDVIHMYGLYGVRTGAPSYSENPATSIWCTAPPASTGPSGYDRKPLQKCYMGTRAKNEVAAHIVNYGVQNNFFKAGTTAALLPEVVDIANNIATPASIGQFTQWLEKPRPSGDPPPFLFLLEK